MRVLFIEARDGSSYVKPDVSNVREAKRELRWTSACGEQRTMPLVLIDGWWERCGACGLYATPACGCEVAS